jgi:hypothetical protein
VLDNGLLEQPVLLLRPVTSGEWSFHAVSGHPVGSSHPCRRRGLFGWWTRGRLWGVYETCDHPLVFTVERCWGLRPWYEVRDAEDHRVGYLMRNCAWDRFGRRVAVRQPRVGKGPVARTEQFVQPDGVSIAEVRWSRAEGRLIFLSPGTENPFTRMLLLAAALLSARGLGAVG